MSVMIVLVFHGENIEVAYLHPHPNGTKLGMFLFGCLGGVRKLRKLATL